MKKISCLIVEDEPASQEILKKYVGDFPALVLKGICSNAFEAGEKLRSEHVDLIFLDINMPRLSGLEFYRSLTDPPPVIFTTAYPEYAVNGFEVNAIDYLVKPFAFDRFVKAVNRFTDSFKTTPDSLAGYLMLMADKKMHKTSYNDILFVEGMGDYVKVHTTSKMLVVHITLQKLQEQLPVDNFLRIHKSFIISLARLEYIEGNMAIINKQQVPIGQTYRNEFLSLLQTRK
jgi:two-component system LytT family response regulator